MAAIHALVISADATLLGTLEESLAGFDDLELVQVASLQEVQWHLKQERADLAFLHLGDPAAASVLSGLGETHRDLPIFFLMPSLGGTLPSISASLRFGGLAPLPLDGFALEKAVAQLLAGIRTADRVDHGFSPPPSSWADLEKRSLALATLLDVARSLASKMDLDSVLHYVVDVAVHLAMAEEGYILLPAADQDSSLVIKARGGHSRVDQARLRVEDSLAAAVFQTGKPMLIAEDEEAVLRSRPGAKLRSLLNVPIGKPGHSLGVLSVVNRTVDRAFENDDLVLLSALGDLSCIALENARLLAESQEMAASQVFRETVAALSHHVNNPLTALIAGIHALGSRIEPSSADASISDALRIIQRKANEIAAVISVLQDVAIPTSTSYWKEERMIDIEVELRKRLRALSQPENARSNA